MKIEFIYTFEILEQQIASYPFSYNFLQGGKDALIEFAITELSNEEKGQLLKISCCIYSDSPNKYRPHPFTAWYDECKGKLWCDDLHNYKKRHGIEELVSETFRKEFYTTNHILEQ